MLDLDWRTILFQILNFGVIVLILAKLVFKPLRNKLAERGQTISDALQAAQDQEAEAERHRAHWEARRAQAEADGEEIIRAAEERAQERAAQILREARNSWTASRRRCASISTMSVTRSSPSTMRTSWRE